VVVDLLIPVLQPSTSSEGISHLRALASDLEVSLTTLENASEDLRALAEVGDIKVEELDGNSDSNRKVLVSRTCSRDLVSLHSSY
jgi:hypothetical protein